MTDTTPYSVPKEPGRWRAIVLALVVHAALIAFLWVGIRWQSETPIAVEAEIWSPQAKEAAPRPQPEPEPAAKPEPKPVPVVKAIPKPVPDETPIAKPDIALEQEKKRKAQELKERQEEQRIEKLKAEKQKAEQERKEKAKADEKRLAQQKADAEAKKKSDAESASKKALAEKNRKQETAEAQQRDKERAEEMRRIAGGVTGTGGTGTAPKSQGGRADAGYASRVAAKIKSNTVFNVSENLEGNPFVEYEINLLPDGSIRSIKKLKSSNVSGFDDAVQRAIDKSAPYPPDKSGIAPQSFTLIHRPKDQ